jgi:hypothetical protein
MSQETDTRMWSTTPRLLFEFVEALWRGRWPSVPVRTLQKLFQERDLYPARDFPQYCVPATPDAFFSYHSAQNFVDIKEIVWQAFTFAARQFESSRPDVTHEDLEALLWDGVRLWVDFMFIDQSARNLREELTVLPRLLQGASAHFVLGSKPLMRAWCCYEIALFNQQLARTDVPILPGMQGPRLRSYIAPSRSFYLGWERTETSDIDDKAFIEEQISSTFPGGFDGFNYVMAQANSVAVAPIATGNVWSTPAADENLNRAVETWYARSIAKSE